MILRKKINENSSFKELLKNVYNFKLFPATALIEISLKIKKRFYKKGEHILVSSFPKSGSTFLSKCLCDLSKIKYDNMIFQYSQNEHDLYLPSLVDNYEKSYIAHHHLKATDVNIQLMNQFGTKQVVIVRNLYDCLVSLREHFSNESYLWPMCHVEKDFFELDTEKQYDFLIAFALPWYINHFVSWQNAKKHKRIDFLYVRYEDLISDKLNTVSVIVDFLGWKYTEEQILKSIQSVDGDKKARFNKGIIGRGSEELTQEQISRIRQVCSLHQNIDFSDII